MGNGTYNILLAVHEPVTARYLKCLLVSRGFHLSAIVSSGEDAVRGVLSQCPDVVVMDLMPGGEREDIDAAMRIRTGSGIPVILLLDSYDTFLLQEASRADVFAFVIKHTVDENLDTAIRSAMKFTMLENSAMRQERIFRSMVSLVPGTFFLCDMPPDGEITCVTGAITDLTGLIPSDLKTGGMAVLRDLAVPASRDMLDRTIREAMNMDGTYTVSYIIRTRTGVEKKVTEKGLVLREKDGTARLCGYLEEKDPNRP